MKPGLLETILSLASEQRFDLVALARSWARALPAITLVPVFALRGLPAPFRFMIAILIAACVAPAWPSLSETGGASWPLVLVEEVLRGIPIGIAAAVPLYALSMAGGLVDHVRGTQESLSAPWGEAKGGVVSTLFSLLAGILFFGTGGPARLALALMNAPGVPDLRALVGTLLMGVSIALTLAAPLLAAAFVLDVAAALVAKAAQPAPIQPLTQPLKAAGLMMLIALTLPYLLDAALAMPV